MNLENDESIFVLTIKVKEALYFDSVILDEDSYIWLSYEYLGNLVQTDIFRSPSIRVTDTETNVNGIDHIPSYLQSPQEDDFRIEGTFEDVIDLLEENELEINVCSDQSIIGLVRVSLPRALAFDNTSAREWQDYRSCNRREIDLSLQVEGLIQEDTMENKDDAMESPILNISVCLEKMPHQRIEKKVDMKSKIEKTVSREVDEQQACSMPLLTTHNGHCIEGKDSTTCRPQNLDHQDDDQSMKDARIQLEKDQEAWIIRKRNEEEAFRRHLRRKEDAVRQFLERQVKKNEEEHAKELDLCRDRYKRLELRLKKALSEVEAKERTILRSLDEQQAMYDRKLVEVEIQAKSMRDSHNKSKAKEGKLEKQTEIIEESPQIPMNEKAEIIEIKKLLEDERSKRNEATLERDHYRLAAHKLAKMVRDERENNQRRQGGQSVHVSTNSGCSERKNQQRALNRIKSELSSLQNIEKSDGSGQP